MGCQDASWAGEEPHGGDWEPTCKELVYSWLLKLHGMRRGGHTGQSPGGSFHASKELTTTAARGSRLHRQPPSIPDAHFMPTHPDHQVLQEISRNKEEQTGRCQSRAKPGEVFWHCL